MARGERLGARGVLVRGRVARNQAAAGPARAAARGARAYGPLFFRPGDIPHTRLEPLQPGDELPGGLRALDDGRGMIETPLYLPEQRALVFADGMTAPEGELLVWATPWHEQRVLPALRALLELPFEHVLVSHGAPVHVRDDFEAALERAPWSEWAGA